MDVYLVPVGGERFECYYEATDDDAPEGADEPGFFGRLKGRFQRQLREAERARHQTAIDEPRTLLEKAKKRSMLWIVERIAEQRLLWHLRKAREATLFIATDQQTAAAQRLMRESLKRDADRHLKLLAVHSVLLLLSAPVALIPGPNVFGYLFTFTVAGHFLAWRGARHGLNGVRWEVRCSDELAAIRRAFALDTDRRQHEIREVAERLHMPRMATWVERMSAPPA